MNFLFHAIKFNFPLFKKYLFENETRGLICCRDSIFLLEDEYRFETQNFNEIFFHHVLRNNFSIFKKHFSDSDVGGLICCKNSLFLLDDEYVFYIKPIGVFKLYRRTGRGSGKTFFLNLGQLGN